MPITGNPRTFTDASDVTDETATAIYAAFDHEIAGLMADGDAFKAALRAIARVRNQAVAAGWSDRAAETLASIAGVLYGKVLGDMARDLSGSRR
jgi:hypothetical protein